MHFSQLFSSIAFLKVCFKVHKIWLPFFSCQSLLLSTSVLNDTYILTWHQISSTRVTVQSVCLTAYLCFFTSTLKQLVDISASLLDPKGPLPDHLPTVLVAETNKEVLKAVAEAKEPKKKGPYIKVTQEYKAKVANFASINGIIVATCTSNFWGRT